MKTLAGPLGPVPTPEPAPVPEPACVTYAEQLEEFSVVCANSDCRATLGVDSPDDLRFATFSVGYADLIEFYLGVRCPHCEHTTRVESYSSFGVPSRRIGNNGLSNIPHGDRDAAYERWALARDKDSWPGFFCWDDTGHWKRNRPDEYREFCELVGIDP